MNCERAERDVHAWIDGQLQGKEREEVERHVQECAFCRSEADRARAVRELVGLLPQPVPSRDLDRLVMASFLGSRRSNDFPASAAMQTGGFRLSSALTASIAALAILFGISAFYLGWTLGQHQNQPANPAVIEQTNKRDAPQAFRSGDFRIDARPRQSSTELKGAGARSANTLSLAGFKPIREPRIRILGRQAQ